MRIWTDGGCIGNGQADAIGAWAFVSEDGHESSGRLENTTNNRAELQGIIEGMSYAYRHGARKVTIYTDSLLCVKCGLSLWKRRANLDLWAAFQELQREFVGVELFWVKGHSGIPENERADELCSIAMAGAEPSLEVAHLRSIAQEGS